MLLSVVRTNITVHLVPFQSPILEQKGPLPQLIERLADALLHRREYDASPMVSLAIPYIEERLLLHPVISRICDRFDEADLEAGLERDRDHSRKVLTIDSVRDCRLLSNHAGPVIVNIPHILESEPDSWVEIQRQLINAQNIRFSILVSGSEIGTLVKIHSNFSSELPEKIYRAFQWPDPANRSCSVKRDYFIHFVSEKSPVIAEVIQIDPEACALLRRSFKQLSLDDTWIECLRAHAHRYVDRVELFNDEHPTKVLESCMKELCRKKLQKKTNAA